MVSTRRQARESEEPSEWMEEEISSDSESERDLDEPALASFSFETTTIENCPLEKERLDRLEREVERQRQGCCSKFWGVAVPGVLLALKIAEFMFVYSQLK